MTKKSTSKKIGYYHLSTDSNQELIKLFEEIQNLRINQPELHSEKEIVVKDREAIILVLKLFKSNKLKTADDFYRASMIFQHGTNFKHYALAVTLAIISDLLGEPWGKGLIAMSLDRFLLSIKQEQFFGTNFEKRKGIWLLAPYNKKTTDKQRTKYLVPMLKTIYTQIRKLNDQPKV